MIVIKEALGINSGEGSRQKQEWVDGEVELCRPNNGVSQPHSSGAHMTLQSYPKSGCLPFLDCVKRAWLDGFSACAQSRV